MASSIGELPLRALLPRRGGVVDGDDVSSSAAACSSRLAGRGLLERLGDGRRTHADDALGVDDDVGPPLCFRMMWTFIL